MTGDDPVAVEGKKVAWREVASPTEIDYFAFFDNLREEEEEEVGIFEEEEPKNKKEETGVDELESGCLQLE